MAKTFLYAWLFFIFIIQGTLLSHFLPMPQLVLNGLIFLSLYLSRQESFLLALAFGLLQDIIYGPAIGISSFSILFIVYLSTYMLKYFKPVWWMVLLIATLAHLFYQILIYGWYRFFGFTQIDILSALIHQIFPSLLVNVIFCYPMFLILRWIVEKKEDGPVIFH